MDNMNQPVRNKKRWKEMIEGKKQKRGTEEKIQGLGHDITRQHLSHPALSSSYRGDEGRAGD